MSYINTAIRELVANATRRIGYSPKFGDLTHDEQFRLRDLVEQRDRAARLSAGKVLPVVIARARRELDQLKAFQPSGSFAAGTNVRQSSSGLATTQDSAGDSDEYRQYLETFIYGARHTLDAIERIAARFNIEAGPGRFPATRLYGKVTAKVDSFNTVLWESPEFDYWNAQIVAANRADQDEIMEADRVSASLARQKAAVEAAGKRHA